MGDELIHFTSEDRKMLIRLDTKVERLIQDMAAITNGLASKSEFNDLEKRVTKLEETNSWIVKTVFGIIITAVMAIVFSLGK